MSRRICAMKSKTLTYSVMALMAVASICGCGHGDAACDEDSAAIQSGREETVGEDYVRAAEILADGDYRDHIGAEWSDSMPDDGCVKMKINILPGGALARVFNDSNYVHYAEAKAFGIEPIMRPSDVLDIDRPIVAIKSCDEYMLDSLRYSYPYLIPEATKLLRDIGARFNAEQKARGGGHYRLKVTSLLRTQQVVRRLRRVNRIAVDSSAHRFATTFDISYVNFYCDTRGGVNRTQEDLKNLLAEILYDMCAQGRCYIKYERKQGCFHITTRDVVASRPRPTPPPELAEKTLKKSNKRARI